MGGSKGQRATAPIIEATVEQVSPTAAGYVVEVALRNRSLSTVAAVTVEGVLERGGQTVETSSTTIDYVPGESIRCAGLFFKEGASQLELDVRALGYAEP